MLRQSSAGGNKRSLGIARLSNSHFFPLSTGTTNTSNSGTSTGTWGRPVKSNSLSSVSSGSDNADNCTAAAPADSDYIMQLVNDVRHFADVLLQLKEAFNSKGM